jgi:hypothetical protein
LRGPQTRAERWNMSAPALFTDDDAAGVIMNHSIFAGLATPT